MNLVHELRECKITVGGMGRLLWHSRGRADSGKCLQTYYRVNVQKRTSFAGFLRRLRDRTGIRT